MSGHIKACRRYTRNLKAFCYTTNLAIPEYVMPKFDCRLLGDYISCWLWISVFQGNFSKATSSNFNYFQAGPGAGRVEEILPYIKLTMLDNTTEAAPVAATGIR